MPSAAPTRWEETVRPDWFDCFDLFALSAAAPSKGAGWKLKRGKGEERKSFVGV
jgi:hypothetical protein